MARGRKTIFHRPIADRFYGNMLLGKVINRVMRDGKKSVAEREVYGALDIIKKQHENPLEVFSEAIKNISPQMEVRSRRIGGAAYQVPTMVRGNRKMSLAIRWLIAEAQSRPNTEYRTFAAKLAAEILDAFKNEGSAVKRKETVHKMAEANRAFSHFRW
jgi:small subunit ribosomal protein S7